MRIPSTNAPLLDYFSQQILVHLNQSQIRPDSIGKFEQARLAGQQVAAGGAHGAGVLGRAGATKSTADRIFLIAQLGNANKK